MQDPKSIVLTSAISELFLRKLSKQGFVRYTEGGEFVDTRQDLVDAGDASGGDLKDMDDKLTKCVPWLREALEMKAHAGAHPSRIENLKDMVLYRFGSTGVVQVLARAAELLGLVPVFPVRNIHAFTSSSSTSDAVFRDCVLVKK